MGPAGTVLPPTGSIIVLPLGSTINRPIGSPVLESLTMLFALLAPCRACNCARREFRAVWLIGPFEFSYHLAFGFSSLILALRL